MKLNESLNNEKKKKKDKKAKKLVEQNGHSQDTDEKTEDQLNGKVSIKEETSFDSGMSSPTNEMVHSEQIKTEAMETDSTDSPRKSKKDKKKEKKLKKLNKEKVVETEENKATKELNGSMENDGESVDDEEPLTEDQIKGSLSNFRISPPTLQKLKERGVKYLFPIQYKTFDFAYDGKDVIGQARTGTGKTFSFALPLTEVLTKNGVDKKRGRAQKVLVLVPTRELAKQVADDFQSLNSDLSVACVYGGTSYQPQESAIRSGIDVLVGTPGRINDHLEKGNLDFSKLNHVVLDEVDQMLDMGFADIVEQILKSAYENDDHKPQTLLFSATMPDWVYKTSQKYMNADNMEHVKLVGKQDVRTATTVQHLAIKCSYFDRAATIRDILQVYSGKNGKAIIFNQTKKDADELAVSEHMKQNAHVLHGDIPQDKREMVLKGFRDGKYNVLITTDVAARGLDIPQIDLVIQCSPPKDVDSYIHRSGRTGRAGRSGVCILFYKPQEERELATVEQKARIKFKKIGAPSTEDIIKASAADAARSLDSVPEDTLQYFESSAEALIAERGAVSALSAALAVISGSTKIVSRSLLTSREGYTTYLLRTGTEMRTVGLGFRILERQIPEEIKEQFQRMRMCKDKQGCVFDVPADCVETVDSHWQDDDRGNTLTKATELPELLESTGFSSGGRKDFSPRGRGGGRGGESRGRGSGRGDFRGRGRGNFRGNFNSRGRGGGRGSGSSDRGGRGGFGGGGGFKRKSDFGDENSKNKIMKFDD